MVVSGGSRRPDTALGMGVVGNLNGFVGFFAESAAVGSRLDLWSLEAGVVLPLGVRTEVDVSVSRPVAGGPNEWFIGAAIVRRLR
jgi:hypothetical protein